MRTGVERQSHRMVQWQAHCWAEARPSQGESLLEKETNRGSRTKMCWRGGYDLILSLASLLPFVFKVILPDLFVLLLLFNWVNTFLLFPNPVWVYNQKPNALLLITKALPGLLPHFIAFWFAEYGTTLTNERQCFVSKQRTYMWRQ